MAEVNKERLHIRLHVYNEDIDVTINRDEEEYYRNAAKLVNERLNAYNQVFKGRKSDNVIALMTLIDVALSYERERSKNDTTPYDNILGKLTAEIEEALK